MVFPRHIFKSYDIRGLSDGELSEELAYNVGRAFVNILRSKGDLADDKRLVVGRDMRLNSPTLATQIIRGITDEGVDVAEIGLASTPLFNFACAHYSANVGGIMVTASHNPAEYNGFKITYGNGLPLGKGTGMDELRDLTEKAQFTNNSQKGNVYKTDIFEDYKNKIFSLIKTEELKPIKLVIDAGNGMAKVTTPRILAGLPVEVEYLYLEPDGNFPNHEANPLKTETLKDLQKKVVELGADFGFAFDGDADRIGLVDEKGDVVEASFVATLIGEEVLNAHPKGKMLYDLRSSQIVREIWEGHGAEVDMCPVGHALIKKMMKDTEAVFASELSLHLYYQDLNDLECTDLSLLYIWRILTRESKPLSEIIAPLKKYFHSGEINFVVEEKEKVMKEIEEKYKNTATKISHLDGVWMQFDWGWVNVRASNTEPVLRLNLEARTEEKMKEKVKEAEDFIKSY